MWMDNLSSRLDKAIFKGQAVGEKLILY